MLKFINLGKIENQRRKAEELDVLFSGRVNKLVLDGEITNEMATSLMNDSEDARKIVRDLVDVAILLYYPSDKQMDQIEEGELGAQDHPDIKPDNITAAADTEWHNIHLYQIESLPPFTCPLI